MVSNLWTQTSFVYNITLKKSSTTEEIFLLFIFFNLFLFACHFEVSLLCTPKWWGLDFSCKLQLPKMPGKLYNDKFNPFEPMRTPLEPVGDVLSYSEIFGAIWSQFLLLFWAIWSQFLLLFWAIWSLLEPSGELRNLIFKNLVHNTIVKFRAWVLVVHCCQ